MKTTKLLYLIPTALVLSLVGAFADAACSPVIGFNKVKIKANADTHISIPFHEKPAFTGAVSSSPSLVSITVEGVSDQGAQFDFSSDLSGLPSPEGLYLRVASGVCAGYWYQVHASTSDSVTVRLNGHDISGIVADDRVTVIPHSTLASVFPEGSELVVSTSTRASGRGSELLIPDHKTMDINKTAGAIYYFLKPDSNPGQWRIVGDNSTDHSETVVPPHSYLIVRHVGLEFSLWTDGRVPATSHAVQIDVGAVDNDNFITIDRPIDIALSDSGMIVSGVFEASTSTRASGRRDELLVVDNGAEDFNKSANVIYFYFDGTWRLVGDGAVDHGADKVFKAGEGVILRKKGGVTQSLFLNNVPTY